MEVVGTNQVLPLFKLAEKTIRSGVTPCNACSTYEATEHAASRELGEFCLDVMLRYAKFVFDHDLHLPLKMETLKVLLDSDYLNVGPENEVLDALWRWGRYRCGDSGRSEEVEKVVDGLLPSVRWSRVDESDRDAPWWILVEKNAPLIHVPDRARRQRKNAIFEMVSSVINLNREVEYSNHVEMLNETVLVKFSVNRDIFLTASVLEVHCDHPDFVPYRILVNGVDVTDSMYARSKVNLSDEKSPTWFTRRITAEFESPILLSFAGTNTILFRTDQSTPIWGSVYESKNTPSRTTASNQAAFTVLGDVVILHELFYFVKNNS